MICWKIIITKLPNANYMTKLEFKRSDLFFETVLAFLGSYIGYHFLFFREPGPDKIPINMSGKIIGKLEILSTIPEDIRKRNQTDILTFELDETAIQTIPSDAEKVKTSFYSSFWLQQMIGHSYEISEDLMQQKFGNRMNRPSDLQFFRHIRNGCFHKNKFKIEPGSISTHTPTTWRNVSIDYLLNGTQVIGGLIGGADPIVLLYDVQKLLE